MRFLVDECLPEAVVDLLTKRGHDVLDPASAGLRGLPDEELWRIAAEQSRVLVTRDLDYPIRATSASPAGLILIRVPDDYKANQIAASLGECLESIDEGDLVGRIVVIAPGRIRLRPLQ